MLLKKSSANQEAVQTKRQQKKKEAAERVGKRGGKTAVCVSVVFIPPPSRSLLISRLWGCI